MFKFMLLHISAVDWKNTLLFILKTKEFSKTKTKMRATIILVLLALMMSMTIEVDGLAFSPEQTNEDGKYSYRPG